MRISFPYEQKSSRIFKRIRRPIAVAAFWSKYFKRWLDYTLIVDTGADYTLFPLSVADDLGIDLEKDADKYETRGIGGSETVYILRDKIQMKLGGQEVSIVIGILGRDDLPPLLGRTECLDLYHLVFSNYKTFFISGDEKIKVKGA